MKLHSREIDFTQLSETEILVYKIEAEAKGKRYSEALKDQLRRQGVTLK